MVKQHYLYYMGYPSFSPGAVEPTSDKKRANDNPMNLLNRSYVRQLSDKLSVRPLRLLIASLHANENTHQLSLIVHYYGSNDEQKFAP